MSARLTLRLKLLLGPDIAIGPGKAELLEAIRDTGSISAAGRLLGMSYRRAWMLIDTMNSCFKSPVVRTSKGGSSGGTARLTEAGENVLRLYRQIEMGATAATSRERAALGRLAKEN